MRQLNRFEVQFSKCFINGNLRGIQLPCHMGYTSLGAALETGNQLQFEGPIKTYEGNEYKAKNIQIVDIKTNKVVKAY